MHGFNELVKIMNNKKKIYYDEAERLYVIEQMNIEELGDF